MSLSITSEEWISAELELERCGHMIKQHVVCFGNERHGHFGTGTLCNYNSMMGLLTAAHVARSLKEGVVFILDFDGTKHEDYPIISSSLFEIVEWDQNFDDNHLKAISAYRPKDLAFIKLSDVLVDFFIGNKKQFYPLKDFCKCPIPDNGRLFTMGGIESYFDKTINAHCASVGPYGIVKNSITRLDSVDYFNCNIQNNNYGIKALGQKPIESIWGLSGGPIFHLLCNGLPCLCGIVIYERMSLAEGGYLCAHGPNSIKVFFEYLKNM